MLYTFISCIMTMITSAHEVPLWQFLQVLRLDLQKFISFRKDLNVFAFCLVYADPASDSLIGNQLKHHAFRMSWIKLQSASDVLKADGAVWFEHDSQFFLLHVEQQLVSRCQIFLAFWAEVEVAVVAMELFDVVSFVCVDQGNQLMNFFFIFEGNRCVVVQRIIPSILSQGWTLYEQTDQHICLQYLFKFWWVAVLSLFEEGLSDIESTIFEVSREEHALSDGQFEHRNVSLTHICFTLECGYSQLYLMQ